MNIHSVIELYGGGPGSGCNPEVANPRCGRPEGSGAGGEQAGKVTPEIQNFVKQFEPVFQSTSQKFHQVVGNLGLIEGRLKTPESLAEKLVRKNEKLQDIKDAAGLRVTVNSMQDLTKAVANIKQSFKVTWEEDKISNPTGGVYRAYHLVVEEQGKPVELQVRTQNQSKVAIWMHDTIYKGALRNSKIAVDYAKKVSDYLYNLDMGGRIGSMPPCPSGIPCFDMNMPFVQHVI